MTKTVDLNRLKDAVGLKFKVRRWGNRSKADLSKVETAADKTRLSMTKSLICSTEYDDICTFEANTRKWIRTRTVPSFFAEGIYLTNVNAYLDITKKIVEVEKEFLELVEKFIVVYPDRVKASKNDPDGLKDQFRVEDYPDANSLRDEFAIESCWISFSAPDNLPPEFRKKEAEKLEKQMSDAADCIMQALREGFLKLVNKATEQMVCKPGEKPRKFFDSSVEQIVEFIDTFKQRNLTDDAELEKLIAQAKEIVGDPAMKDIRKSAEVKAEIGKKFEKLARSMEGMVEVKRTRVFTFEE